jgi:hypothetical protein
VKKSKASITPAIEKAARFFNPALKGIPSLLDG